MELTSMELTKRCLKTKEAAAYLGCSKSHVEKLVHSGKLKPVKLNAGVFAEVGGKWWFDIVDLDKFVEKSKESARGIAP
jgi:excisionase family DNA binding protein